MGDSDLACCLTGYDVVVSGFIVAIPHSIGCKFIKSVHYNSNSDNAQYWYLYTLVQILGISYHI